MHVHYFQHVSFEGLGIIEDLLLAQGHTLSATRFYEPAYALPEPAAIDALIVLGGPMGVYDDREYPWLAAEKAFLKQCLLGGKKILGICLGAQLLAVCLGAAVRPAGHKEIGWFPVAPTEACGSSPWFYELFRDRPVVFHWHGDAFDAAGTGSPNLLDSPASGNQAFAQGNDVIALQFHLEATAETVRDMLLNGAAELSPSAFVQDEETLVEGVTRHGLGAVILEKLLHRWLYGADAQAAPGPQAAQ